MARSVHPRAEVTAVRRRIGGLTADMDRVTVETPTGSLDVVLRRWRDGTAADGLVAREAQALVAVRGSAVAAPELIATDEDGHLAGVCCTLTSALDGEPDLVPSDLPSWLGQLAATQATIHAVTAPPLTRWDGFYEPGDPLDWLEDDGLRRSALEAAAGQLSPEQVFVHGDYQHFNVLWDDGRLSGVVDWPNAGTGSRGADVGHCRLNLAVLFGARPAADYLAAYERAAGLHIDRRADLRALLNFGPSWQGFIPRQVAGRSPIDVAGMPARVAQTVRDTLDSMG